MPTAVANRPLVSAKPVAAPAALPAGDKPVAAPAAAPTLSPVAANTPSLMNGLDIIRTSAAVGQAAGRVAFTPPVIVDIFKSSIRSGFSLTNIAWFVVPSAIRNGRDVASDKISVGRAAANVSTEATMGIGKGIMAGTVVQSLSIATGPLMGLLPISPAILPFVSIGVGLVGMVGTYWVMNKVVKATGIDQKMADTLTRWFGGDKAGTTTPPKVQ
ncbi:MAG: hypothetical protein VKP62_05495 [Candidatus Sericytochromatia bacterium]|nr:hypothetical protein [Candidatus Sericytochromatia bacterium]